MAPLGTVGEGFMQSGIAWSDEIDATYLVDTTTDRLYFYEPGGVVCAMDIPLAAVRG